MRSFFEIFLLELRSLVRSRSAFILFFLSMLWMFVVLPMCQTSDGTEQGERILYVKYSLWGVFAMTAISAAATAAGSLAKERASGRLQLSLVRPVALCKLALGRFAAILTVSSAVLALAGLAVLPRAGAARPCSRVLSPIMESPREEAEKMYHVFMNDPDTPEDVKKTDKALLVKILTQRARDHYQTIPTNTVAEWEFPPVPEKAVSASVAIHFSTMFANRQEVEGIVRLGDAAACVSNYTQTAVSLPLDIGRVARNGKNGFLRFENLGKETVMLRPRMDINILYGLKSDVFGVNLFCAWLELVALVSFITAVSMFFGACLSRSVAVFGAMTFLFVAQVSPEVGRMHDEINATEFDRLSLSVARFAELATRPLGALSPVEALADDRRIPAAEVLTALFANGIAAPLAFSLLSAIAMRRRG